MHSCKQARTRPRGIRLFETTATATGNPRGRARRTHLITWLLPLKLNSPSLTEPHPNKQLITSHPPFAFDSNLVAFQQMDANFIIIPPLFSLPPPGEPESELRRRRGGGRGAPIVSTVRPTKSQKVEWIVDRPASPPQMRGVWSLWNYKA